ncbi:hypothetical protein FACS1894145_5010 [Bacteroidia bacterium]|nr:hypothetical protein FACS1894145_5010 [Bacteroidia bacterium]
MTVGIFTYRNYPIDYQKDNTELSADDVYINDTTKPQKQKKEQVQSPADASDAEVAIETPGDTFPSEPMGNMEETVEAATEETSEFQKSAVIYIPQTKSLLFNSQNPVDIHTEKVYYLGENGKLKSHVNRNQSGVCEDLYSYDEKGNQVDKLEIGYICDSTRHLKCAVIFRNKISIYETKLSADNKNEEIVVEYLISPDMKFSRGKTYTKL